MGVTRMPRQRGTHGMQQAEETEVTTTTEAVEYAEPTVTPEAHTARRLVKLPGAEGPQRTIWLVEDGVRYPIARSDVAAATGLKLEAVDEETLRQWPQGDTYTGA